VLRCSLELFRRKRIATFEKHANVVPIEEDDDDDYLSMKGLTIEIAFPVSVSTS